MACHRWRWQRSSGSRPTEARFRIRANQKTHSSFATISSTISIAGSSSQAIAIGTFSSGYASKPIPEDGASRTPGSRLWRSKGAASGSHLTAIMLGFRASSGAGRRPASPLFRQARCRQRFGQWHSDLWRGIEIDASAEPAIPPIVVPRVTSAASCVIRSPFSG